MVRAPSSTCSTPFRREPRTQPLRGHPRGRGFMPYDPGVSVVATDLAALVTEERREFAARNPESARLHDAARRVLPGGHTRTILDHEPFPLTFVRGEGAVLTDAD